MKKKETYKCPFCGQGNMVTRTMDHEIMAGNGGISHLTNFPHYAIINNGGIR